MKRKDIALAATAGLTILGGSVAYASGKSDANSAAELQSFLKANPAVAALVPDVEAKTGGTVAGAEFDDETAGNGVIEFEVKMADGAEQTLLYTRADGSMKVMASDDEGDDEGRDDDGEHDDDGETDDDGK